MTQTTRAAVPPGAHFIASMGISLEYQGAEVLGRAVLTPAMWGAASRRPRLAILAGMVDVVAGHAPDGPRTPTIDLRIQTTGAIPDVGEIGLAARVDRLGRRLVVAETLLRASRGQVFARARTTFANRPMGESPFHTQFRRPAPASFEELVDARVVGEGALELTPRPSLANGAVGTVQGGVQAFVAELAGEQLLGPGSRALDLDIRFLDRVAQGPLRAQARRVGRTGKLEALGVTLSDEGDGGRTVSVVSLLYDRVPAAARG